MMQCACTVQIVHGASILVEVVLRPIDAHSDGHVWTGDGAHGTSQTARGVMHAGMKVPLNVDFLRHADDFLRTSKRTALATLTLITIDNDFRHDSPSFLVA